MEVVRATSYGYRTVIVVCHNPGADSYVHDDGSRHIPENVNGCPADGTDRVVCHTNHQIEEFIFDGPDQYEDGILRTADSYWDEICLRCIPMPIPVGIDGLVGRSN